MTKRISIKNSSGAVVQTSAVSAQQDYSVSTELRRLLTNINLLPGDTIEITEDAAPAAPAPETTPVPAAPSADTAKPVDLPLGKPKAAK